MNTRTTTAARLTRGDVMVHATTGEIEGTVVRSEPAGRGNRNIHYTDTQGRKCQMKLAGQSHVDIATEGVAPATQVLTPPNGAELNYLARRR